MNRFVRVGEAIQYAFTWVFIRLARRSQLKDVKSINLLEEPIAVYTYEGGGAEFAQATLVGTIIWNETRSSELSDLAKKLILHHELSHRERNPIFKGIGFGLILAFASGMLILLKSGLAIALGVDPLDLVVPGTVAFGMIGAFLSVMRVEETLADYHALRALGDERFLEAYDELREAGKDSMLSSIIGKIFYTKPEHTVWLHNALE